MCMCSIFIIQQEHILQDILTYRHITEKSKKNGTERIESYLGCLSLSLVKYFSRKTWTARNFSMWNQTTYSPQWDRRCTAKLSSIGFNSGRVFFFFWGRTWLATMRQMFRVYPEAVGDLPDVLLSRSGLFRKLQARRQDSGRRPIRQEWWISPSFSVFSQ